MYKRVVAQLVQHVNADCGFGQGYLSDIARNSARYVVIVSARVVYHRRKGCNPCRSRRKCSVRADVRL